MSVVVSVVYGTTANVAGAAIRNFRIGDSKFSNRPVTFESNRIESNLDVRFEFEWNMETSQVLIKKLHTLLVSLYF